MAHHHLTIARATFAASLLRPDVSKVSRDDVPQFYALLETATLQCSPSNIQKCKQWLLDNILPSSQRTAAFARFLTAFARHVQPSSDNKRCSVARQSLHILYLLNDLLHHAVFHAQDHTLHSNIVQAFQTSLVELVRPATIGSKPRVCRRLEALLSLWETHGYFRPELISQAKAVINDPSAADTAEQNTTTLSVSTPKELSFIMPSVHGDPSLPFYELPAGNFMPHIIPNKAIPMRSDSIRPLQFAAKPADESLVNAVRDFLEDVEGIDREFDRLDNPATMAELDEMGQISYRDEAGGRIGDTYYGWSRAFCEKMRRRGHRGSNGDERRSGSRSTSMSRSPSRSPRKRRRDSDSGNQTSRSNTRSRSRSSPTGFQHASDSHSRSRSPPPRAPNFTTPRPQTSQFSNPQSSQYQIGAAQMTSHPPFPPTIQPPFPPPPFATGGVPIPPPRPPNWQGPWPPPPPPPPGMSSGGFPRGPPMFGRQSSGPPAGPRHGHQQHR